mgnify:CR=1 FL=1
MSDPENRLVDLLDASRRIMLFTGAATKTGDGDGARGRLSKTIGPAGDSRPDGVKALSEHGRG